jgi:biopolymer transport protein ExbD
MKFTGLKLLKQADELNIVAFMNLMVILVPFLLITAVFSEMTILELNLPKPGNPDEPQDQVKLQLELVLRPESFDLRDGNVGLIKTFKRTGAATNWNEFSNFLLDIKRRFPQEQNITLLIEPSVDYKTLIAVMDHVRSADTVSGLSVVTEPLFPNVSIGDAAPLAAPAGQ